MWHFPGFVTVEPLFCGTAQVARMFYDGAYSGSTLLSAKEDVTVGAGTVCDGFYLSAGLLVRGILEREEHPWASQSVAVGIAF